MIRGDEWKGDLMAPSGKRESPSAPSARGPKWTVDETTAIELAYGEAKGSPTRFHAKYNAVDAGLRSRTLAELMEHLPTVAKARGFEVPQKFLDDCDAAIDGLAPRHADPAPSPPVVEEMVSVAWLRSVWARLDHCDLHPYNTISYFGAVVFGGHDPDEELAQRVSLQRRCDPADHGWSIYPPPLCEGPGIQEWWVFSPGPYAEARRLDLRNHNGKLEVWGLADDKATQWSWCPLTAEYGLWWRRVVAPDLPGDRAPTGVAPSPTRSALSTTTSTRSGR